jgi:hypothetical protein
MTLSALTTNADRSASSAFDVIPQLERGEIDRLMLSVSDRGA